MKRLHDVFMYQLIASAGIVSVNQFRRAFLVLAAAAGFFQCLSWVIFLMVHDEKFFYNRSNATNSQEGNEKTEVGARPPSLCLLLRCAFSFTVPSPSLCLLLHCAFSFTVPSPLLRLFLFRCCRCSICGQPHTTQFSPSALSLQGWCSTHRPRLLRLTSACSLSRLLFLSHLARFTLRVSRRSLPQSQRRRALLAALTPLQLRLHPTTYSVAAGATSRCRAAVTAAAAVSVWTACVCSSVAYCV